MNTITAADLQISSLGPCRFDSPFNQAIDESTRPVFVADDERILLDDRLPQLHDRAGDNASPSIELAGPREKIFFNPDNTTCAIVTCGGLCPGLNNVIRNLVIQAHYRYGLKKIYGIRYGFEGLNPQYGHPVIDLTPQSVEEIHRFGGTYLGTSRGPQDTSVMVNRLGELGVNILFVVGGDGSQRGAADICRESRKRGRLLSVIGVPKTIDNDLMFMDKSFGYETAFAASVEAVNSAHCEAKGSRNGVGLVKLMGRESGFIACSAALATGEVNVVLIPEIPFQLEGPNGLLEHLRRRLVARQHAVIVVAEGAGQDLCRPAQKNTDASGNTHFEDIGRYLKHMIEAWFKSIPMELNLKYIDPSYILRSVPADANDSVYCAQLARHALHAAMAGKTGLVVGRYRGHFVHLPIDVATRTRSKVDPRGDLWLSVVETTGQPARFA